MSNVNTPLIAAPQAKIRILIVDDHVLMRVGLTFAINQESDLEVVGEAGSADEALSLGRERSPDVVILDLRLPDSNGIELIGTLRSMESKPQVIVYTNYGSGEEIASALGAGANGFLIKDAPQSSLLEAIRVVAKGKQYIPFETSGRLAGSIAVDLSNRESEVLKLISKGMSNRDIAKSLDVAESTVKGHISSLLTKLGVNDRTQAVLNAYKRGLIHLD